MWPHLPRRAGAPAMPVRRLSRQHTQANSGGPEQARTAGRAGMTHSPALDRPRRPTHGTKDQLSGWTGLLARGLRAVLDANRESLAKARGRVPGGPPAPGGLGTLLVRSQGLEGRPGPLPPTGPRPERVVWPAGGAPPAACASPTCLGFASSSATQGGSVRAARGPRSAPCRRGEPAGCGTG